MRRFAISLLFFLIVANCLFIISQIPVMLHISRNPAGSLYPLVHFEFSHDYYAYLAAITQGKAGYLLHFNSYSSEPAAKGIFLVFYLIWGHVARFFFLSPFVTYHLARIVSLELFFLSIFVICALSLGKKYALITSLLFLIITIPAPQLYSHFLGQELNYSHYPGGILWWADLDAFVRLNGIPHHIFGQAMLVLGMAFLMIFKQKEAMRFAIIAGLLFFIGGSVFPAVSAVPVAVISVVIAWRVIRGKREIKEMRGFVIIFLFALSSIAITFIQEQQGFPWDDWRMREFQLWNVNTADYDKTFIFSFAVYFVMAALSGIRRKVTSPSYRYGVIILWAFLPFILLGLANLLGIPKIRLTQFAPFVPFAILLVDLIFIHPPRLLNPKLQWTIATVILVISIYTSGSILKNRIDAAAIYSSGHQMHIPAKEVAALAFIEPNVGKEAVVLATERLGNIIPAFAPVVSYIGHSAKTKDFYSKLTFANSFFAGKMSDREALEFVKNNSIGFVYFGTDEKYLGKTILEYSFLQSLYEKDGITVYKIK